MLSKHIIAYHEAGHKVMADLLGVPCSANITQSPAGWSGETSIDGSLNMLGMVSFLLGGFAVWAILSQDDPAIRAQVISSVVNRSDLERVRQITGRKDIKPEFMIIRGLLAKHWQEVERVAQELIGSSSPT